MTRTDHRHDDRRQQHPLVGPHALALAVLGPERAGLQGLRRLQVSQSSSLPFPEAAGLPGSAGKIPGRTAAPTEPQEEGKTGRVHTGNHAKHILSVSDFIFYIPQFHPASLSAETLQIFSL